MNANTIVINIHEWSESFEVPAADFVKELQELLDGVPEEHRDHTVLEFDRYGEELSLFYRRMETDDERRAREQHEQRRMTEREARERQELARLKEKYEK